MTTQALHDLKAPTGVEAEVHEVAEQTVEIVSDSGEGAQTAGQLFGSVCAKMNNGVWTVEIIPAEIEPPPRSKAGASGIRIRFASRPVTNMGDQADIVVAFNEQVLYSRIDNDALRPGTTVLLENKWATSMVPEVQEAYQAALEDFRARGYDIVEIPMEEEVLKFTDTPQRGKNVWVLGMLCSLYQRDLEAAKREIALWFERKRKGQKIIDMNHALLDGGYAWGQENLPQRFVVPPEPAKVPKIVVNGNAAVALGILGAGIEVCSMYPITPATSVSHYLATFFHRGGGFIHQAEDEIAAVGFAIGCSYAGKTTVTVTSGPGMALKTEMIGLAVMAEVPLVIVNVQRGGPSTGLPTKVEQGDLLHSVFGHPGDSPKVVMAPSTIEECFTFISTARKLAEEFRTPVIVLTDANLGTGQTAFPYPELSEASLSPPVDQSPWEPGVRPFEWDPETGLSRRPIPGQVGGQYVLTGLAHDQNSRIAYEANINQLSANRRSRKMATLMKTLKPPKVYGPPEGDLLVVGWGSTLGAIEEAIDRLRAEGEKVSSVHLRFLAPMEPGLKEIFSKFKRVMTVEINYSDE
ncbi:MAG: 2-oxoacid:acceptor oxidoreductase subunit alpha, partial [Deltaproteobacteria bacterium]|nr:2-oxoacid:acceptor oxidoreductase subunit alpha [Deltaproteobacteria bacterium]